MRLRLAEGFLSGLEYWTRNSSPTPLWAGTLYTTETNIYRPLSPNSQEIRLLVVEPGAQDDPIECSFQYRYLKALFKPHYETVSYVWGDKNNRRMVKVNGQHIDVPASAETVLRRFRYHDRRRILWIDALCINQADMAERSSQVSIMYEIYSNTSNNLIWLGESNETTSTAVECLRRLADEMSAQVPNFEAAKALFYTEKGTFRYSDNGLKSPLSPEEVNAIDTYYCSEWFQRLWVVQEAALPTRSTCYMGETNCSLEIVLRAAKWLNYHIFYNPLEFAHPSGIGNARRMFEFCDRSLGAYCAMPFRNSFLNIVAFTSVLKATEPVDRLFGITGLVRKFTTLERYTRLPTPDYTKPVAEILWYAGVYCLFEQCNLELLAHVLHRYGERGAPGLPSWVPHWGRLYNMDKDPSYFAPSHYNACSTETLKWEYTSKSSARELNACGIIIGQVGICSSVITPNILDNLTHVTVADIIKSLLRLSNLDDLAIPCRHIQWLAMTVTAGVTHRWDKWQEGECEQTSAVYDKMAQRHAVCRLKDLTDRSTDDERLAAEFYQAMYMNLCNRCLFTTRFGYLGMGSQTMQPGDTIAILFGSQLPVILRKRQSTLKEFEFVGLCYLHGVMNGEAVERHRADGGMGMEFTLV